MNWTEVYDYIGKVGAGSIVSAWFDYYRTLTVSYYDYERGYIKHVRFNRGGTFEYWQ